MMILPFHALRWTSQPGFPLLMKSAWIDVVSLPMSWEMSRTETSCCPAKRFDWLHYVVGQYKNHIYGIDNESQEFGFLCWNNTDFSRFITIPTIGIPVTLNDSKVVCATVVGCKVDNPTRGSAKSPKTHGIPGVLPRFADSASLFLVRSRWLPTSVFWDLRYGQRDAATACTCLGWTQCPYVWNIF